MEKFKEVSVLILQSAVMVCITLFAVIPFSCRMSEEGVTVYDGDYTAPVIESIEVLDEKTVQMNFSEGVKVGSVVISRMTKTISDSMEHSTTKKSSKAIEAATAIIEENEKTETAEKAEVAEKEKVKETVKESEVVKDENQSDTLSEIPERINAKAEVSEDGCTVTYTIEEECKIGESYEIFGTVEDKTGNSLTFCVPFTGYNSRVPELIFTEVQIKYAKGTDKGKTVYRGEFVELLALCDGNLGGLELVGGADGDSKKYVFPAVEVSQGEVILVHLRTVDEGCVNEVGDNLNEAFAPYAIDGIRDLWSENTSSRFNDDSDVILLRNSVTDTVLDAFMYVSEDAVEWKKGPAALAKEAAESGIYESDSIENAVLNYKTTAKKSFRRIDVDDILDAVMEGLEYEYPVKQISDNWEVSAVSPGSL